MATAIAEALDHGGELVRWKGGFWTYPNCPIVQSNQLYNVPAWYIGWRTVLALEKRGALEIAEWRGTFAIRFKVTEAFKT